MHVKTKMIIFLSICGFILKCVSGVRVNKPIESNSDAKRLYDDLLSNYNRLIRPVNNNTEILTVRLGIKLSQLTEVNLRNQVITASIWVVQEWIDCKLQWDPLEYGGLEDIYVPSELIWLPDIVLFNNADGNFEVTLMTKANLKYTGEIKWEAPAIYKLSCEMNVLYFPFDEQHCLMKFGSWTYNGFQVDLKHVHQSENGDNVVQEGIDLTEFLLSVEWDILGVPASRNEELYKCCKEPYADITFNMVIRRKTLFYTVNLIIPLVGITFLTVLVFYLPSDSGEKVSLCSSILVSLTVFFLLLAEIIPPTSLAVPLLGKYLLFTMTLVTLSICVTVCVLNVHFRSPSTHEMSPWVTQVFLHIMPHLLLMRRPPYSPNDLNDHYYLMENAVMNFKERMKNECCSKLRSFQDNAAPYGSTLSALDSPASKDNDKEETTAARPDANIIPKNLSPDVLKALNGVCFIAQQIENTDKDNEIVEDWKYVSMVLDRFFLWTFTIACIVGTCIIIFQAPSLYDQRIPIDQIVRTKRAQLLAQKNYSLPVPSVLHVYDAAFNP